jgi:site-specific recombinase XerD
VRGKGNKQRLIFLPDQVAAALAAYLPTRAGHSEWLFVNKAGQRVGNTSFARLFRRLKRRAGLGDRDLTPHRLRHFYATQLLRSAVDVKTVQELLGHSDLGVTSMYLHTGDTAKRAAALALPSLVAGSAGEVDPA